jgi:hypothetical protein
VNRIIARSGCDDAIDDTARGTRADRAGSRVIAETFLRARDLPIVSKR